MPQYIFALLVNSLLVVLIFRLRLLVEGAAITQSQRWGLSLLGGIYLSNCLGILSMILESFLTSTGDKQSSNYFYRMVENFNLMASMFLLVTGLIYPRPIAKWQTLRVILVLVAAIWTFFMLVQILVTRHGVFYVFNMAYIMIGPTYWLGTFIPIFLWIFQYEKQSSPDMRMVLMLLIWGYLLYHASTLPTSIIMSLIQSHSIQDTDVWVLVLITISFLFLIRTMYHQRGHWGLAEKVNLFFIIAAVVIGLWNVPLYLLNPGGRNWFLTMMNYTLTSGLWMFVRPALLFYGLMRYQFFGPSVRADKSFSLALTLIIAGGSLILGVFAVGQIDLGLGMVVGLIAAAAVVFLLRARVERFVNGLLPMAHGASAVSLSERRATYAVGLQSAVVAGEVSDPEDVEVLKRLRKDLRVSDREHELLMSGLSKEKPPTEEQEVEEVYLFHRDGTLLGFVVRQESGAQAGKRDMMVTMFTAVREFSKDALKKGADYVGAIDYGSTVLIIEIEGEVALGVVLRGRDNPQVRQRMRDLLRKVIDGYSDAIKAAAKGEMKDMAQTKQRFRGLEAVLREFLKG